MGALLRLSQCESPSRDGDGYDEDEDDYDDNDDNINILMKCLYCMSQKIITFSKFSVCLLRFIFTFSNAESVCLFVAFYPYLLEWCLLWAERLKREARR